MLEIPDNKFLSKEILNEASAQKYLLGTDDLPSFNGLDQKLLMHELGNSIKKEQFNFSINIKKNCITNCNGIQRWLGYTDNQLTIKKYLNIIHPAHGVVKGFYAVALFDFLTKEKISCEEMLQLTYVSLLALMHRNGKYIYCKKESRPIILTKEAKILEYVNEFTIVKEFNNEHYGFRIYDIERQRFDLEEKIINSVKQYFEKRAGFSVQELRILKRYGSLKDTTSEKVAASFKIERSTVSTYNKRILNKAENIFEYRFANAQKVAEYFNYMNLI